MYWNIRSSHECTEICDECMFRYEINLCGKNVICAKGIRPPTFPPCRYHTPQNFFYSYRDEKNEKRNKK